MTDITENDRDAANIGRRKDVLACVFALTLLGLNLWKHRFFFHDDAYISLRYAQNLVCCGELTWNLGEYHEGYTNFLYVLMSAGLMALGVDPVAAVQIINGVAAFLFLVLVAWGTHLIAPGPQHVRIRGLAVIAAGATPGLAVWVLGGLEPVVVAAFLTAGSIGTVLVVKEHSVWRGAVLAASAFTLAVLTRMDTAVFIAIAGFAALFLTPGRIGRTFVVAFLVAGVPGLISLGHMGWRLTYYGEFLPLTFYAKTSVPSDLRETSAFFYILRSAVWAPLFPVILAYMIPLAVLQRSNRVLLMLLAPIAGQSAYLIWAGGDHMEGARLYLPLLGTTALALVAAARHAGPAIGLILVAVSALAGLAMSVQVRALSTDPAAFVGRLVGEHIARTWDEGQVIALHTAGSTPFYATDMVYIDMLGLNDPIIAKREDIPILTAWQRLPGHSKGSAEYVLARAPDIIIPGLAEGVPVETPIFLTDAELAISPDFERCYALREALIPYDDERARRGPVRPQPLTFRYYERICDDD